MSFENLLMETKKDESLFPRLYQAAERYVSCFANHYATYAKEQFEDVAQELWVVILNSIRDYDPAKSPSIARHVYYNMGVHMQKFINEKRRTVVFLDIDDNQINDKHLYSKLDFLFSNFNEFSEESQQTLQELAAMDAKSIKKIGKCLRYKWLRGEKWREKREAKSVWSVKFQKLKEEAFEIMAKKNVAIAI